MLSGDFQGMTLNNWRQMFPLTTFKVPWETMSNNFSSYLPRPLRDQPTQADQDLGDFSCGVCPVALLLVSRTAVATGKLQSQRLCHATCFILGQFPKVSKLSFIIYKWDCTELYKLYRTTEMRGTTIALHHGWVPGFPWISTKKNWGWEEGSFGIKSLRCLFVAKEIQGMND